jgi:hypothetical protein
MPKPEDMQALKSFVQEGLGCGCPEEVFSKIEIEKNPVAFQGLPIDCLVRIGDRLLVGICLLGPLNGKLGDDIVQALTVGKQLRDGIGFNRFRLVFTSEEADSIAPLFQEQFDSISGLDDRVHLHVVRPSVIPAVLGAPWSD